MPVARIPKSFNRLTTSKAKVAPVNEKVGRTNTPTMIAKAKAEAERQTIQSNMTNLSTGGSSPTLPVTGFTNPWTGATTVQSGVGASLPNSTRTTVEDIRLPQQPNYAPLIQAASESNKANAMENTRIGRGITSSVDMGGARTREDAMRSGGGTYAGGSLISSSSNTFDPRPTTASTETAAQPSPYDNPSSEVYAGRLASNAEYGSGGRGYFAIQAAREEALSTPADRRNPEEQAYVDRFMRGEVTGPRGETYEQYQNGEVPSRAQPSTTGTTQSGLTVGTSQSSLTAGEEGVKEDRIVPGSISIGHKDISGNDADIIWPKLDENPADWSVDEAYRKILAAGNGSLNIGSKSDRELVNGVWKFKITPSEQSTMINALPKDVRDQVVSRLRSEGYFKKISEVEYNNPLYASYNKGLKGSYDSPADKQIAKGSLEDHIINNMLTDPDLRTPGGDQRYFEKNGTIYERRLSPEGSWEEIMVGTKGAIAAEVLSVTNAFLRDGELDVEALNKQSSLPYTDAIIEGVDSYTSAGKSITSMDGSNALTTTAPGGEAATSWEANLTKELESLDAPPELDPTEAITALRNTSALSNAKNLRINMNRMARSGSSPEAIQGATAELQQQNDLALQQQEAQVKLQIASQNLTNKINAINTKLQIFQNMYNTAVSVEQQEKARAAMAQAQALSNAANMELQRTQMAYAESQKPGFWGTLGQIGLGVAGTLAAPLVGGASLGLASAGLSALGLGSYAPQPYSPTSPTSNASLGMARLPPGGIKYV